MHLFIVGQQIPFMDRPTAAAGCPPGLEYLSQLDQIIIKQQVELLESKHGWKININVFNKACVNRR